MSDLNTCEIEGCEKPTRRPGGSLCSMHYIRKWRHGDPNIVLKPHGSVDPADRFWSKVDKRGETECWPWLGVITTDGYGQFAANRKRYRAHRYAYELVVGPIPEGYHIDHVRARGCTRTDCVNPAHLEAVTPLENLMRSDAPSAVNARKVRCKNGHEFEPAKIDPRTGRPVRWCRTCYNAWARARAAELRGSDCDPEAPDAA